MKYAKSKKYSSAEIMSKIMGPNPIKLTEELLNSNMIRRNAKVCDLGSGQGLTSVFMAKEYGYKVVAADLWSNLEENTEFFKQQGLTEEQIISVKADAQKGLPFQKGCFDAIVSVDSYNYFGRDKKYLDAKLLPYVKSGGYVYIAIPGLKFDFKGEYSKELLLSWTPEQLEYMKDIAYWSKTVLAAKTSRLVEISEMKSNDEVWADWIAQDNEYAVNDRKSIAAGATKYLNFIKIVLQKL